MFLWENRLIPTVTLKETGYELYSNGVAASLIKNEYHTSTSNMMSTEHMDETKGSETSTDSNGAIFEEEDPKIINQKPIEIGPGPDGV